VQLDDIFAAVADQDKGRDLELQHPATGEPTGIKLTVVGPDSDTARRARLKLVDELADLAGLDGKVTAERRDAARLNYLAALVLRWDAQEGDQPVSFTTANVLRLLRVPWVEQQVDAFAGDRRNFA
jgi:hypothetical protein